jgi:hypothetical protein
VIEQNPQSLRWNSHQSELPYCHYCPKAPGLFTSNFPGAAIGFEGTFTK